MAITFLWKVLGEEILENYMKRAFLRAQKHYDFIKKLMRKLCLKLSILPLTLRKNSRDKNLNVIANFFDSLYISKVTTLS